MNVRNLKTCSRKKQTKQKTKILLNPQLCKAEEETLSTSHKTSFVDISFVHFLTNCVVLKTQMVSQNAVRDDLIHRATCLAVNHKPPKRLKRCHKKSE